MLVVLKKKYDRDLAVKQERINDLEALIGQLTTSEREKAVRKLERVRDKEIKAMNESIDAFGGLDFELLNDDVELKPHLPSRAEYDERLENAIKMFQKNHPISDVATRLHVAKKTARRYLRIAISKRKVKKAQYDQLNK